MRLITPLIVGVAATLTSCTNYPKQYTYSPNVSVNGDGNNSNVALPSPFAKKPQPAPHHINQSVQTATPPAPLQTTINNVNTVNNVMMSEHKEPTVRVASNIYVPEEYDEVIYVAPLNPSRNIRVLGPDGKYH